MASAPRARCSPVRTGLTGALALSLAAVVSVFAVPSVAGQSAAAQSVGLRIVVIEGEGAVNIIQQKTAVAPVVEVRDRNDLPVSGAAVTFTISGGNTATFAGGVQTLTVTTNAAGRAVVGALNPLGSGAFQINVQAAFQGQTAAAAIAQTNVLTAAEAASATSAGAGAGGAGGGGGLSVTTIGILGGVAAGGAVAARELGLIGGGTKYTGQFSGTLQLLSGGPCLRNEQQTGEIEIAVTESSGSISGTAQVRGDIVIGTYTCGNPAAGAPQPGDRDSFGSGGAPLSGSPSSFAFSKNASNRFPPMGVFSGGINAYDFSFTGALNGAEIAGVLMITRTITNDSNPSAPSRGTITYNVTLR